MSEPRGWKPGALSVAVLLLLLVAGVASYLVANSSWTRKGFVGTWLRSYQASLVAGPETDEFSRGLVAAARRQTERPVVYDAAYVKIAYPNGDVPADRGVCADVVVRAYRALGIDLQVLVHEDMSRAFSDYPRLWGLLRPDTHIDHRRVPNLMTFFRRHGTQLPIGRDLDHYVPGNIVAWDVSGRVHIGIVSDVRSRNSGRPYVIHNIGAGPKEEDRLFDWPVLGNFSYRPQVAPD